MIDSIKKNKNGILLMVLSSICVCFGQLLWKMSDDKGFIYLLLGFFLYGIGALIMLIAYKFGSLSVLQPMLSLNYIISLVIGHQILNEDIDLKRIIGITVVIIGVVFIAGGDK